MPTATATRRLDPNTEASGLVPGICAAEADLITASARRFLSRTSTTPPDEATVAVIARITTLYDPHTPATIIDYICEKPNDIHWCTGSR